MPVSLGVPVCGVLYIPKLVCPKLSAVTNAPPAVLVLPDAVAVQPHAVLVLPDAVEDTPQAEL